MNTNYLVKIPNTEGYYDLSALFAPLAAGASTTAKPTGFTYLDASGNNSDLNTLFAPWSSDLLQGMSTTNMISLTGQDLSYVFEARVPFTTTGTNTVTYDSVSKYYTIVFSTSGSLTFIRPVLNFNITAIGGGGGGGGDTEYLGSNADNNWTDIYSGGGGQGGGYAVTTTSSTSAQTYSITVGTGGAAGVAAAFTEETSTDGSNGLDTYVVDSSGTKAPYASGGSGGKAGVITSASGGGVSGTTASGGSGACSINDPTNKKTIQGTNGIVGYSLNIYKNSITYYFSGGGAGGMLYGGTQTSGGLGGGGGGYSTTGNNSEAYSGPNNISYAAGSFPYQGWTNTGGGGGGISTTSTGQSPYGVGADGMVICCFQDSF